MKFKCFGTGSKGNMYRLSHNERYVFLDVGLPYPRLKEACGWQLDKIDFVFVSQAHHQDHAKALPDVKEAGLSFIAPPLDDWESDNAQGDTFNMGDWIVRAWRVEHDDLCWAGLFYHKPTNHRICYITDFSHSSQVPAQCDTLIIEVNYVDECLDEKIGEQSDRYLRLKQYHMSLRRAKEFIGKMMESDKYNLKNIICVHLSDKNSDADKIKQEIFELTGIMPVMAEKGTEITL